MTQAEIERAASEYAEFRCSGGCESHADDLAQAFLAGAERAREKWVPVSERLPQGPENVLVYIDYGSIGKHKAIHSIGIDGYYRDRWTECAGVTHWMPLPSTEGL